ncbi:hypothetical protein EJ110_NYTH30352 [Nymphaea thermarum]|nr:hypothetical protein EJ110_NYTH30352 [Nymphaea thermarum]
MRFHYVFVGWEGSATYSRVLYSALDIEIDPFVIPTGKYYLGDGGYPNIHGLLTPYRGHRYHLSEHRGHDLITVEQTFGRLKRRFPIIKAQVSFPYHKQVAIVLAMCVLHNFIIEHNPHAEQFVLDEGASDDANESSLLVTEIESVTQNSKVEASYKMGTVRSKERPSSMIPILDHYLNFDLGEVDK